MKAISWVSIHAMTSLEHHNTSHSARTMSFGMSTCV